MKKIFPNIFLITILSFAALQEVHAMYNDWFTAYHETIICVDQNGLQPGMTTYPMKPDKFLRQQVLGKANFKLKRRDKTFLFNKAKDARLVRTVYGFKLTGTVENLKYIVDCAPMIFGRKTDERNGGMVIKLTLYGCKPNDEILINYGGLTRGEWVLPHSRYKLLEVDDFPCGTNNIISVKKSYTTISSPDLIATVGITAKVSNRKIPFSKNDKLNTAQAVWKPGKGKSEMFINVAFAKDKE